MNRTVILACSARKRSSTSELSALARYDGPAWRTLRANMTCLIEPPFALSARFGLISAYQEIPDYDQRMTSERALELIDPVSEQLVALIRSKRLRGATFLYGGELYRNLFRQSVQLAELELGGRDIPITYSSGGIGEQLGQLKDFLTRDVPPVRALLDEEGDE